jgi:chemotaxis regulatin CheY-phosphate phosphatase CheZ
MNQNLKDLLNKANELRALFIFGQRVIPFLEEIFIFVNEIEPLLEEINVSIADNLKKMPNASKQLSKVTEATELATNEIMDILDNLTFKTDIINANFQKLVEIKEEQNTASLTLLKVISSAISQDKNLKDILPEINQIINLIEHSENSKFAKIIDETKGILQSINMDSSSIMMSLQVQDITSQQLAAVNHLIETVQQKLISVIEHFNKADVETLMQQSDEENNHSNVTKLHREIAFDPDAVKTHSEKEEAQSSVDELIKLHKQELNKEKVEQMEGYSLQDDVDKLFSGEIPVDDIIATSDNVQTETLVNESTKPKEDEQFSNIGDLNTTESMEIDESFTQDDIDALFGK